MASYFIKLGTGAGGGGGAVSSVNGYTGVVVLTKTDIGLGNVNNTSDANKPVSTAQQTALNLKEDTITATSSADYYRGDKTFQTLNKTAVGLGNVDNTSDANKPVSTAQQTALNLKEDIANKGIASGYAPLDASIKLPLDNMYIKNCYGDGSDLDVTLSAGVTTLIRDMFYNNLTINGTASINTAGFYIYVLGILDITSAPSNAINGNGNAGGNATTQAGAAGGASLAAAELGLGNSGGNGATGVIGAGAIGVAGTAATPANGGASGAGGAGGAGSGGAGGAQRALSTSTLPKRIRTFTKDFIRGIALIQGGAGGAGGSSGGGDGAALGRGGAGGGGGARPVVVYARVINRSSANVNTGVFAANGGVGGNSTAVATGNAGAGGGGGGGGGGIVSLFYEELTGTVHTNALSANGGNGGSGGTGAGTGIGGNGGNGASGGDVSWFKTSTCTSSVTVGIAGAAGTAAVGTVGGTGGAGNLNRVSL